MTKIYLFAVLSAVFAGLTSVLAKAGLEGISSNLATTIRVIMLVPLLLILISVQGVWGQVGQLTQTNWLFLFLSAIATGLSWLFYFWALARQDATWVGPIDKSSLLFTMIFAFFFLGENLNWQKIVASLLVLAALGVMLIPSESKASTQPSTNAAAEK
jgi:transporter family protein